MIDFSHEWCGFDNHPIIQQIIHVESGGNPLAIHVNTNKTLLMPKPGNAQEAARVAHKFIAAGYSIDMGAMQINSQHLSWLGLSVEEPFDPCKNIQAGMQIFSQAYHKATARYEDPNAALLAALSVYNTGNFESGFKNGYVAKYTQLSTAADLGLPGDASMADSYQADTAVELSYENNFVDLKSNLKEAQKDPAPVPQNGFVVEDF